MHKNLKMLKKDWNAFWLITYLIEIFLWHWVAGVQNRSVQNWSTTNWRMFRHQDLTGNMFLRACLLKSLICPFSQKENVLSSNIFISSAWGSFGPKTRFITSKIPCSITMLDSGDSNFLKKFYSLFQKVCWKYEKKYRTVFRNKLFCSKSWWIQEGTYYFLSLTISYVHKCFRKCI